MSSEITSTSSSVSSMLEQYGVQESTSTESSDSLGKDTFLNLLVTQT